MTLAVAFKARIAIQKKCLVALATTDINRRYATAGPLGDLFPGLEGRAKLNRRYATTTRHRFSPYINSTSTRWAWTICSHGDHAKTVKRPSCEATSASASR